MKAIRKAIEEADALTKCGLNGILTFTGCVALTVALFLWKLDIWVYSLCYFGASGLNKGLKIIDRKMNK